MLKADLTHEKVHGAELIELEDDLFVFVFREGEKNAKMQSDEVHRLRTIVGAVIELDEGKVRKTNV